MIAPEARAAAGKRQRGPEPERISFESMWESWWRCCEYCGARRALHIVLDFLSPTAWRSVFEAMEDESAGEWAWMEGDSEEWPPPNPENTVERIDREFAAYAIADARARLGKMEGAAQ